MAVSLAPKVFIVPFALASILQFSPLSALAQTKPATGSTVPTTGTTVSADSTVFECISTETTGQYATIARRGQLVTPPMIVWQRVQYYTPQERCQIVSNRLTRAVQANGGRFSNLLLTYGPVNNQSVICYVSSMDGTCNSSNVLLTLTTEDRGHELEILRDFLTFGTEGSDGPLLRGGQPSQPQPELLQSESQQEYAPFGTALEQQLGGATGGETSEETGGETGGI